MIYPNTSNYIPTKSSNLINTSVAHEAVSCNESCSNHSKPTTVTDQNCCTSCNSSHIETASVCSDEEDCHCSASNSRQCHRNHDDDDDNDGSSLSSQSHHHHHHHHHHSRQCHHHPPRHQHRSHNHYHSHSHSASDSESASWSEELKSVSALSASSCSDYKCNQNHQRNKYKPNKTDLNAVMPTSITMKSLAATSSTSKQQQQKRRRRPCCCRTRTHSKITVFFIFFICVLGAIATFFCWPRTPRVSMGGGADALSGPPDWWAGERQPLPPPDTPIPSRPSLRATWQINVTLDNRDNWIPTHISRLDFVIVDSLTLAKFAWASTPAPLELAPGTISPLSLTFSVNYQAADRTDPTFQNLYNACGPLSDSKQRPALNVLLRVSFHIFGITWTPLVTATPYTGGILCPVR